MEEQCKQRNRAALNRSVKVLEDKLNLGNRLESTSICSVVLCGRQCNPTSPVFINSSSKTRFSLIIYLQIWKHSKIKWQKKTNFCSTKYWSQQNYPICLPLTKSKTFSISLTKSMLLPQVKCAKPKMDRLSLALKEAQGPFHQRSPNSGSQMEVQRCHQAEVFLPKPWTPELTLDPSLAWGASNILRMVPHPHSSTTKQILADTEFCSLLWKVRSSAGFLQE